MNYKRQIGTLIREQRLYSNLTQAELARLLGFGTQMVSNIERGICTPPYDRIKKICRILKIDPNEIIYLLLAAHERLLQMSTGLPDGKRLTCIKKPTTLTKL